MELCGSAPHDRFRAGGEGEGEDRRGGNGEEAKGKAVGDKPMRKGVRQSNANSEVPQKDATKGKMEK